MTKKLTEKQIQDLIESRNHCLIGVLHYKNIKSKITIYCKFCQTSFTTSVHSYKNAKKSGCPECKKNKISQIHKNKILDQKTKAKISKANKQKVGSLKGKFGQLHPRWKGGVYDRLSGSSSEAYKWRINIRQRCHYKCVLCHSTKNLECHHLESYDHCKEKRNDIYNGILICKNAHKKFHQDYGYGKNTTKQFYEFCYYHYNCSGILLIQQLNNQQPIL